MFHPVDHPMERGWVGRVDGDRVVQLAAQTLQSFFTGGGTAREHAVYPLADVCFLAPVLHPPSVRVFADEATFAFANPAAIVGPGARIEPAVPSDDVSQGEFSVLPRLAAIVGADEQLAGFTILAEWRAPARRPPKDRDFALGLGPTVVTAQELEVTERDATVSASGKELLRGRFPQFDWAAARDLAAAGTALRPGDLLAGPALGVVRGARGRVEISVPPFGVLAQEVS